MELKINNLEELEALAVIVRLVNSRLIAMGVSTVSDWCRLRSMDKLLVQLALKVVRGMSNRKMSNRKFGRTTVNLDEMQMSTLYVQLQQCGFPHYELNLANRVIAAIEREYYNNRS